MRKYLAYFAALTILLVASIANAAPTKSFAAATVMLPGDIEIVGTSNVKQLRSTETFKKVFPELLRSGAGNKVGDILDKIKKSCGIDTVNAIDDATLGLDRKERGAAFIAVNVSETKVTECLTKIAKSEGGATVTTKKSGGITEVKSDKSSKSLFYSWLPGDVLVVATDPDDRALLERMIGGKGALAKSKLAGRLAKVDSSATLSIVWSRELPIDKMTVKNGELALTTSGGNLAAAVTAEMGSSTEADKVAQAARSVTSLVKVPKSAPKEVERVLKSVDAKASGNEVRIGLRAAEKDLVVIAAWAMKELMGRP